jgi:hypothetical protein
LSGVKLYYAFDQPQREKKNHGTDNSDDNGANQAATDADPQRSSEPAANESADDADDDVDKQTEASAFHDFTGQPAGYGTDYEPRNDSAFHWSSPRFVFGSATCGYRPEGPSDFT